MKPMLARTYNPRTFSSFPGYIQPKLNGIRALYSSSLFQSRDEKIFPSYLVSHLLPALESLKLPSNIILDGELYRHGWPLGRISGALAVHRGGKNEDTEGVEFHVFDVVDTEKPEKAFSDRWADGWNWYSKEETIAGGVYFVSPIPVGSHGSIKNCFHYYVSCGYEGIMIRTDAPYDLGERFSSRVNHMVEYRSKSLWKYKSWEDGEYDVIGVEQGVGKAEIGAGSLVCLIPNRKDHNLYTFTVGTGFSDEQRVEFLTHPPSKIKIRYTYLNESGVPQNPSFLCVL